LPAAAAADAAPAAAGDGWPPSPQDEGELVARVQRGDRAAFDVLARRYARRAYEVAYRVLRHRQDAEDLVQDAFMAALDGIATFDTGRPFAPWFFRIVVNRSLNARKARAARERHLRPAELREDDAHAAVGGGDVERAEIRERFAAALARLPERQRLIVQLADVDERTSAEIGEMLHLPSGTVRWHLHQARRVLREALAPLKRQDR
jgi:RNA polymerase sigma-70 factor (ECF subfamily)